MFGLDDLIVSLGEAHGLMVVLGVALLLGLRHASDPDHLVAVSTLVAGDPRRPGRRAALLGLLWGCGHACTLFAVGLPVVLFGARLPLAVQRGAEVLVGVVIMALAIRLLRRWREARFHAHHHAHGDLVHRHLHMHEGSHHQHQHVRSPVQAYLIGLVHGVGGSATVGLLLLASIRSEAQAAVALGVFALGTAVSMAVLSSGAGYVLASDRVRRRFTRVAPVLGGLSLAFGAWYSLGALQGSL